MKPIFRKPQKGYALATILILLGVCMFGAAALVTISILESKISRSHVEGTVAYYVAEAGVTDAVWRLNNDTAYTNALAAGTLNVTYAAADTPATGQGFTVTMVTSAEGAGYATITVTGTADNGTFTAQRKIETSVFRGSTPPGSPIGDNVFFGGGSLAITNGGSDVLVTNGDLYMLGNISIHQATVNAAGRTINAEGSYSASGATVTSAGIYASNYPPAPSEGLSVPGYDFTQYTSLATNKCTAALYAAETQLRCTPAQFESLIGADDDFSFPNPVVYIDGSLSFTNWARDKTITTNGLFVVNGNLSSNNAASNFQFVVNDPGTGRAGIIVKSNVNNGSGTWTVNGVMYASGSVSFTNNQTVTIDGAVVAGGSVNINTGLSLNLAYNETRIISVLGGITNPSAVRVLHWEEEY
ncbi:MAG TPA: hypothetical protein VLA04_02770 [Verrucomicrobiae bacterium]|nr:hypothetical protein [Verrucomicrobiae bacterium]